MVGIVLLPLGCGGHEKRTATQVTPKQAVAAVKAFDATDLKASIERLDEASFGNASLIKSLAPYLKARDASERQAAVYLSSLLVDAKTAPLLEPALSSSSPADRTVAAAALAQVGVVAALPVLIAARGSREALPYGDPPEPAASLAQEALVKATGMTFASPTEWQQWWKTVKGRIHWSGERFAS